MEGYKLVIRDNTYVSLYFENKFVCCYDNDTMCGEGIVECIEERTKMNFYDMPVEMLRDFEGFWFLCLIGRHSFYSDEVRTLIRDLKR